MDNRLWKSVIVSLRRAAKAGVWTFNLALDIRDALLGRREPLVPPRRMVFIGAGDYRKVGDEFLHHFAEKGGLRPSDRVLDIGCGVGRMALPLTGYLDAKGSYEGYDIVPKGIRWCSRNFTPSYPNFRFHLIDAYNERYYPRGKTKASEYRFPHADGEFDFIFLTSVFTHMYPKDMENYLSEISRLLKVGGRCFITYFLLNGESLSLMEGNKGGLRFVHVLDGCRTAVPYMPESALAYDESAVRGLYAKYGLDIKDVYYGYWSGRKASLTYQDVIVAEKGPKP